MSRKNSTTTPVVLVAHSRVDTLKLSRYIPRTRIFGHLLDYEEFKKDYQKPPVYLCEDIEDARLFQYQPLVYTIDSVFRYDSNILREILYTTHHLAEDIYRAVEKRFKVVAYSRFNRFETIYLEGGKPHKIHMDKLKRTLELFDDEGNKICGMLFVSGNNMDIKAIDSIIARLEKYLGNIQK